MRETFQAFIAGDDSAFSELYRELNPRLAAYCHKLARDHAADIVQSVWERVIELRTRPKMNAPRGVGFLFVTARNLIIDEHRKRKNEIPFDEDGTDVTHRSDATHLSHVAECEEATDLECIILDALEKLSFEDREVLVLNIYSGYKFGEIAEMQGKSVDAIWARASRARIHLREIVRAEARRLGVGLPDHPPSLPAGNPRGDSKKEIVYG
ncbi:MAG: RNA polymerase sigma factor [Bacteroidota bacterium]|nr:RNA polymerase sigma factor [Bacteroidota bacterium]MDP4232604.1 RNA polymerase sigma factor [Bacteroidota bacterium]MDP4242942.1 RNA polymerase sigma factor [Bacteroidota bacterium]MDP4286483.1 RNA polymerase sigma factor [Bacteroidota bacterium]